MPIFLDRIDSAPLADDDFSFTFNSWISVFVDTLNQTIEKIQNALNAVSNNGLIVPQFTTVQITTFALTASDGTMWYATDAIPPNIVIKINGVLVQLTTAPFP